MAVSFLTFNLNGCSDSTKREEVQQFLNDTHADVLLLSETHATPAVEDCHLLNKCFTAQMTFALCKFIFRQYLSLNYDFQWIFCNAPKDLWPPPVKLFSF
jgi:hypothetical protein